MGLDFRASGLDYRASGLDFRASGFDFRASGQLSVSRLARFRVKGLGFRV